MKNILHFDKFVNEGFKEGARKFLYGHETQEKEQMAEQDFMKALDQLEVLVNAQPDRYFNGYNWPAMKTSLMNQAAENRFRGGIDVRPSMNSDKLFIVYKEGLSGLQMLAVAAAGAMQSYQSKAQYENKNGGVKEGFMSGARKFVTGYETKEEEMKAQTEFMENLEAVEALVMANPSEYFAGENWPKYKMDLMDQAKENKFRGGLQVGYSASGNSDKQFVIYKPGLTGLEIIAQGAAERTANPLGK
jgi:hypothetical protein